VRGISPEKGGGMKLRLEGLGQLNNDNNKHKLRING
jgi:hypothetical protein